MPFESLIPWRSESLAPWRRRGLTDDRPFGSLQRAINEMLEDFWQDVPTWPGEARGFRPRIDFSEDEQQYHIAVELPGVKEEDVDVSMTNGTLTIRGEKKEEREDRRRDYYRHERSFGAFYRTVPIPAEVNKEQVSARFRDGVLRLTLPKSKEARESAKQIEIKAE